MIEDFKNFNRYLVSNSKSINFCLPFLYYININIAFNKLILPFPILSLHESGRNGYFFIPYNYNNSMQQ